MSQSVRLTAFEGTTRLTDGSIAQVTKAVRLRLQAVPTASILAFDQLTGQQTDLDLRDTPTETSAEVAVTPVGPGRPKLGVIGKEVTLLPRHWEWLSSQPGGASVALRKLVENARRENSHRDDARQRQEAAYKFMSAIAGNLPGYEEALRSLFANDRDSLQTQIQDWPIDVRDFAIHLAFDSPVST